MKTGSALVIIATCFQLGVICLFSNCKTQNETSSSHPNSGQPSIARPAVKVILSAKASGSEEERLGARDYLSAATKKSLPGVVQGMSALCSEFHFYDEVQSPDFTLVFLVTDTNDIGIGVVDEDNHKPMKGKRATSIDSAYFTACGMLRKTQVH
jgi:hypothetical protein